MIALPTGVAMGLLLAAIPTARHAHGMGRRWARYRHGPAHIDHRRAVAAWWWMATAVLVLAAVFLLLGGAA